jgi:hypothetical protein
MSSIERPLVSFYNKSVQSLWRRLPAAAAPSVAQLNSFSTALSLIVFLLNVVQQGPMYYVCQNFYMKNAVKRS